MRRLVMGKKIRVIVVDDSALVRSLLAEIINRQHDMECIGTANDPLIAREMILGTGSGRHPPWMLKCRAWMESISWVD